MHKTKEKINKKGISLIVLVITIIVIIILVAAVILTLTGNNPISEARKATFLNDVATFKDDLNMYKTNEYAKRMGDYDPSLLNATSSGLTYNGTSVSGQDNIYDAIQSLEGKSKYNNEFEIANGELKYTGINAERADWAQNIAGIVADSAKPTIEIATSNLLPVKAGTSVIYNISMTSSVEITTTNLNGNIKILNNAGVEIGTQPSINIGSVTGTTTEKNVTITINTTGMAEGIYKLKILGDAIKTASQGNIEAVSNGTFEIDNTVPNMPTITIDPTIATNENVTATITKANASDTLEYSTNGTTWIAYTTDLTVTSNLTVYARETDSANNVSNQATQIISNIDKILPQNATMSLTTTGDKINGTITIADSGSGINVSQSKYIVTTQSTAYATTDAVWNSATVMGTTSKSISETKADGTYYVQVLSKDNAGNKLVNVSSAIVVKNLPVIGNALSTYTWAEIKQISNSGKADDYFNVGDEKNITLTTGEVLTFQIYDFKHDDKSDGSGKAGITFGMKHCMAQRRQMNSDYTNAGGWGASEMRAWISGTLFNQLPSDLKTQVVQVDKYSSAGENNTYLVTTKDYLFLFSDEELGYTASYSAPIEGYKYPIFNDTNNYKKIMSNGTATGTLAILWYWLRVPSINSYYSQTFEAGYPPGFFYEGLGNSGAYAINTGSICFGFCI